MLKIFGALYLASGSKGFIVNSLLATATFDWPVFLESCHYNPTELGRYSGYTGYVFWVHWVGIRSQIGLRWKRLIAVSLLFSFSWFLQLCMLFLNIVFSSIFYRCKFKFKVNPCTNLGVFIEVYPVGLLFTWNDLIRATVEQKLIFEPRIS